MQYPGMKRALRTSLPYRCYETREKFSETNQVSLIKNEGGEEYIGVQRIPVITLYGIDGVQQRIKLQKRYNLLQQCPKEEIMFQGRRMTL